MTTKKEQRRLKIKFRIRKSVNGTAELPQQQADLCASYQRFDRHYTGFGFFARTGETRQDRASTEGGSSRG